MSLWTNGLLVHVREFEYQLSNCHSIKEEYFSQQEAMLTIITQLLLLSLSSFIEGKWFLKI